MDLSWGTDLNAAFNTGDYGGMGGMGGMGPQGPMMSSNKPHQVQQTPLLAPQMQAQSMQMPGQRGLEAQQAAQQQARSATEQFVGTAMSSQDASNAAVMPGAFATDKPALFVPHTPGYFERLGARRGDIAKMIELALIVTLGLSLHWLVTHYAGVWIEKSDFEAKHELFARCVYPVGVALLLWNVKAFR
jgi:hypothetical protein